MHRSRALELSIGRKIEANKNLIPGPLNLRSNSFEAIARSNCLVDDGAEFAVVTAPLDHGTGRIS